MFEHADDCASLVAHHQHVQWVLDIRNELERVTRMKGNSSTPQGRAKDMGTLPVAVSTRDAVANCMLSPKSRVGSVHPTDALYGFLWFF